MRYETEAVILTALIINCCHILVVIEAMRFADAQGCFRDHERGSNVYGRWANGNCGINGCDMSALERHNEIARPSSWQIQVMDL